MKGLSADLRTLINMTNQQPVLAPTEREEWMKRCSDALQQEQWDDVLAFVRNAIADAAPGSAAYVQSKCWENLGDPETAAVFRQEAERQDPSLTVLP
jgi:hypothetical protein